MTSPRLTPTRSTMRRSSGSPGAAAIIPFSYWMGWVHWGEPIEPNRSVALELARKAVAIDPNDPGCRWVLANLLSYERSFAEADAEFAKAFELDPNEADAWATLSDITVLAGRVK